MQVATAPPLASALSWHARPEVFATSPDSLQLRTAAVVVHIAPLRPARRLRTPVNQARTARPAPRLPLVLVRALLATTVPQVPRRPPNLCATLVTFVKAVHHQRRRPAAACWATIARQAHPLRPSKPALRELIVQVPA